MAVAEVRLVVLSGVVASVITRGILKMGVGWGNYRERKKR
jgi:hypothetical protein